MAAIGYGVVASGRGRAATSRGAHPVTWLVFGIYYGGPAWVFAGCLSSIADDKLTKELEQLAVVTFPSRMAGEACRLPGEQIRHPTGFSLVLAENVLQKITYWSTSHKITVHTTESHFVHFNNGHKGKH